MLTFTVLLYIRGKPSLISHICSILTILLLDDTSQCLVELRPHTQSIAEGLRPHRKHHELLHSQSVTSMGAPVDHIKSLSEGQIREMRWYLGVGRITLWHNKNMQDSQEPGGPSLCFLPDQQCDGTRGHLSLLRQLCIWQVILQE